MTADAVAGLSPAEKRALLQRLLDQQRVFPVSAGQRRLWFLQQLAPGSAAYHFPVALRIVGAIDVELVRRSLQALLDRHSIFRTVFVEHDGELAQRVEHGAALSFDVVDCATHGDAELRALVSERASAPMDLGAGPLFHCTLFRPEGERAVLLLVWHHIVLDGWSLALALEELGTLYAGFASGQEPGLPPAPPYTEFVEWQRRLESGEQGAAHAAFWQKALQHAERLDLPTDHARPLQRGYRGGTVVFTLGESLTAAVRGIAAEHDTTPFVVLLAAFQAMLHRVAGKSSVPVTFPVNGRTQSRFERTAGYFVNQVAVDGSIDADTTIRQLIASTRVKVLGALAHQDYHLSLLPHSPDRAEDIQQRVADVMFVLQKSQGYQLEVPAGVLRDNAALERADVALHGDLGGLPVATFPLENDTSRFDLELHTTETGRALVGWLMYDADLFEKSTAEVFSECFQQAVAAFVRDPDERVSRMRILGEGHAHRLLTEWQGPERDWPASEGIAELFGDVARRVPDTVAARCGTGVITFRQLDARSNRIAHWLRANGVQPQQIVGICVPRSLEMLAALLGIIKAGCIYLPLDPASPDERLEFMVRDSSAPYVVTVSDTLARFETAAATTLCITCDQDTIDSFPESAVQPSPAPLLHVIYTSGSTGEPKGVAGTQRGALNRVRWQWEQFPFREAEACAQLTTLGFIDAVPEIFGALLFGVTVDIVADDVVRDVDRLVEALERHRVTRLTLVPSLLRVLLDVPDVGRRLGAVRMWFCSGETLDAPLARRFHADMPQGRLVNLYGCSEAAGDSCWFEVPRDWNGERVPIGTPIANTQVYILDQYDGPVAQGTVGEIHIAGAGLAAGYLHKPALTAERFVANPFVAGECMYRTGDRARHRHDGIIEYLGRADRQVKIRGNRVEPGEVEAALRGYPGVDTVAVSTIVEASDDRALVAYLVMRTALTSPQLDQLQARVRAHVARTLPSYMVPSHVVLLDAMPLTASGKTDLQALPAPGSPRTTGDFIAPRSAVERVIADVWQRVLGIPRLSVDADFFDLGGHSILALQAMSQLSKALRRTLSVAVLFQFPTVASLAAHLEGDDIDERRHRLVAIESRGTRPPLFWVPGGVGILGFQKLRKLASAFDPDQPFYGLTTRWASRVSEVETVQQRASEYLNIVRDAQPEGPYHLVGFCLGGVIAYEMAQQLEAAGERVAFLGLVNTWMPAGAVKGSHWLALYAQRAAYYVKYGLRQRAMPVHHYLLQRARNLRRILRRERFVAMEELFTSNGADAHNGDDALEAQTAFLATIHLASKYKPQHFAGRLDVFLSAETELRGVSTRLDPRRAWRRVSAQCEIVDVGGGHMPQLAELGAALHRALRDAQQRSADATPADG